jgi:hypothetical protein
MVANIIDAGRRDVMAITKWSIPRVNCALLIKSYRSYKSYRRTPAEFELAIFKTGRGR